MSENEQSIWVKDSPECVTLTDNRAKSCVFITCTDGFYLCSEADVDILAEEVKKRLRKMHMDEWAMGHL